MTEERKGTTSIVKVGAKPDPFFVADRDANGLRIEKLDGKTVQQAVTILAFAIVSHISEPCSITYATLLQCLVRTAVGEKSDVGIKVTRA